LLIEIAKFEQRLADALRGGAMGLTMQDQRMIARPTSSTPLQRATSTTPVSGSISTSQICVPEGQAPTVTT